MKIIIITSPQTIKDETSICNVLFAHGLEVLHLRKPDAGEEVYEKFVQGIQPCYRQHIVIHEHYSLVEKYQLHGIHLRSNEEDKYLQYRQFKHISISCHSLEEIARLPFRPDYCFLSPIFDSISKQGYKSCFSEIPNVSSFNFPVVALGGITPGNLPLCRQKGFSGTAVLGYIWERPEEALQRFTQLTTPVVMSIAGADPSAGAGVMADIKTFENNNAYGLAIISGITFQNQDEYLGTRWTSLDDLYGQCELQLKKFQPEYVKIGLIENFEVLDALTQYLSERLSDIKIIWDPILKASAGFVFHDTDDSQNIKKLNGILSRLYLITPNTDELRQLFGTDDIHRLREISRTHNLNILWKGGHNAENLSIDRLITPHSFQSFSIQRGIYEKHGTGCILSAAITAILAQNHSLPLACSKAQLYVSRLIDSNNSKLAYHHIGTSLVTEKPSPLELNLQYITDFKEGMTLAEQVEAVCRGGMRWVQLRMKDCSQEEFLREGKIVREICHRYHALFIINDHVEIARLLDADGVHLGKDDMHPLEARRILGAKKIIGATCNTWEDIILRTAQRVDYIGLGPFTFTHTKKKLSPTLGLEGYKNMLALMKQSGIHIPVFAIGGITESDIPPLMQTGIQGIALSGLIKNSDDLIRKTTEIIHLTDRVF